MERKSGVICFKVSVIFCCVRVYLDCMYILRVMGEIYRFTIITSKPQADESTSVTMDEVPAYNSLTN